MQPLGIVVIAVIMTAGCALRAGPRATQDDWSRVLALAPETDVIVQHVDPGGAKREASAMRGLLLAAGASEIAVRTRTGDVHVTRADVQRIAVVEEQRDSIRNGTLIGAAVGAVYGLIVRSKVGGDVEHGASIPVAAAGIGGTFGAWTDALREGRRTRLVYRRN